MNLDLWLTGFIDGEGCFQIESYSGRLKPSFTIGLAVYDAKVLHEARNALGHGTVREWLTPPNERPPHVQWVVRSKAGCQALVDHLHKYPLRTIKHHDFEIWKQAVELHKCVSTGGDPVSRPSNAATWEQMGQLRVRLMSERHGA
jgi:hypothetical protein